MTREKPKALSLDVPWMVTTAMPTLRVQVTPDGRPLSATFVAYFKLADRRAPSADDELPQFVTEAPPFQPFQNQEERPYHLVRINFDDGLAYRTTQRFSDGETVREDDYDWSAVPGVLRPGEDALGNIQRTTQFWMERGISPDARAYVVEGSPWLAQLGEQAKGMQHFMILGDDDYVEVIARSASWEMGQAVD
jgi:hypothetical protein